jgi:hypothetical protein
LQGGKIRLCLASAPGEFLGNFPEPALPGYFLIACRASLVSKIRLKDLILPFFSCNRSLIVPPNTAHICFTAFVRRLFSRIPPGSNVLFLDSSYLNLQIYQQNLTMATATRLFTRAIPRSSPASSIPRSVRATRASFLSEQFPQASRRGYSSGAGPSPAKSRTRIYLVAAAAAGAGAFYYFNKSDVDEFHVIKGSAGETKGIFKPTQSDYQKVYDKIAQLLVEKDEYDDGSYGPVLVRLAWHASGTYDAATGTGGSNGATMRFAPESDHGANAGLKHARDFLEPVKGRQALYTACI